jgi:hypothetical protein
VIQEIPNDDEENCDGVTPELATIENGARIVFFNLPEKKYREENLQGLLGLASD